MINLPPVFCHFLNFDVNHTLVLVSSEPRLLVSCDSFGTFTCCVAMEINEWLKMDERLQINTHFSFSSLC